MDSGATVCDPACGSSSLLIRAINAAPIPIMGYGQEKESATGLQEKSMGVLKATAIRLRRRFEEVYDAAGELCEGVEEPRGEIRKELNDSRIDYYET